MPLVKLIFPFLLGIIACLACGISISLNAIFAIVVLIILANTLLRGYLRDHFSLRWIYGFSINCIIFCMAVYFTQHYNQLQNERHFSHYQEHKGYLICQVVEPVSERTNTFRAVVRVIGFANDTLFEPACGMLMLYFQKDSVVSGIEYGDRLVIQNRYNKVQPPQNPFAFNYQRFLAMKNIYHSSYIRSGQWQFTGKNHGVFFMRWALNLRQSALNAFKENNLSGREFAVISALLLGYREYLDDDLRREFAGAGAMHILCVSGLHVGIIFMVLKSIFAFLCRLPGGMIMRTLCIILFIWLYAAITGFSPSVLRASVMFTFVAIGQSFNRPTNIYNTLAASAFVLVIANPYIITYIGFQLSYLAVISIVALQPPLYNIIKLKNKLLDKAWSIITVSVAAQLATGPLALFYFNQFPNYFLLTNLVVIPLAGTIIYASLLTLLLSIIPIAGAIMGKILSLIVAFLHHAVRIIEGLPYSTSTGVYLSFHETMLIFMLIITGYFTLLHKSRPALVISLMITVLFIASVSTRNIKNAGQHHFVVYSVNRETAIDFFAGDQLLMVISENIAEDTRQQEFTFSGMRLRHGHKNAMHTVVLDTTGTSHIFKHWAKTGNLMVFGNKRFLIIDQNFSLDYNHPMKQQITTDYLLIIQNPRINMEALLQSVIPELVIIDTSNRARAAAQWEEACIEAGITVWNIRNKGAFVSKRNEKFKNE